MDDQGQTRLASWTSGLIALAGLWLVISPFALGLSAAATLWNTIIIGIVAIVFGLYQMSDANHAWPSWINLIAAIWLVAAPYMFNFPESSGVTSAVWTGIVIGVLSLIDLLSINMSVHEHMTHLPHSQ